MLKVSVMLFVLYMVLLFGEDMDVTSGDEPAGGDTIL
jgi:hypothetical protein